MKKMFTFLIISVLLACFSTGYAAAPESAIFSLISSESNQDMSMEILRQLNSGYCFLGPGDYCISSDVLDMPAGSILRGCGQATRLILQDSGDGYAIRMNDDCQISDLALIGPASRQEEISECHGILWQGNYSETKDENIQPKRGSISNLQISNFPGGGITCSNTGYSQVNNLHVMNTFIENCSAGINIDYWSEYHHFTNVQTYACTFGCINNGGNNTFVNCDFSQCDKVSFLIDNTNGDKPNNAHGSAVGCLFNHTGENGGVGVRISNTYNGFIFSGCQFFFSPVVLENSCGIAFCDSNFGESLCTLSVHGCTSILFSSSMFQGFPPFEIEDNDQVIFVNCYVRKTGEPVHP